MARLIQRILAGYFILYVGLLPLMLTLYRLPKFLESLEGLKPAIRSSNIAGYWFSLPFFLIPVAFGIGIWRSKGLLKIIGWLFLLGGVWLVLSGLGSAGPLNYMSFASIRLLPFALVMLGTVHFATGYAMLKRKRWSRVSGIILLVLLAYSIVTFFSGFVYTRHSLTAIVGSSLPLVIPVALCVVYLMSPDVHEDFQGKA